jgi:hypothetical protein
MPTPPFNGTVWPAATNPLASNAEIVRVTGISTNTLTIVRAQESSTARAIQVGDQFAATVTAKSFTDVENVGVNTATTTYTVASTDQVVLLDATSASFNVTLPTAVGFKRSYVLKAINVNSNLITLLTTSGQTIDGNNSGTVTLGAPSSTALYNMITLVSDGSNWRVI